MKLPTCARSFFGLTSLMLLTASPAAAAAPCTTTEDRPTVGLALSGGGARGAAHVGVLKVLEELNVPVDCIAGTSMGAIVGGLYAAGHSADELQAVIESVDWSDAFRDDPSRDELSFRRRQDDYDFLVDFELGLRGGQIKLPRGLIQGQKLTLLLRRLNTRARHITHFDKLPIPFRAVATDAVTGGSVILGHGELSLAQRASMAAPGVFAPVNLDGRLLIDGGVSNNLPVNVARAMGADIVIAVDISAPLTPRESLTSAFSLSNQALTILVRREAVRQLAMLKADDIAIVPALGSYSSADFSRLSDAIQIGYEAAQQKRTALKRLSLPPADYAGWQKAHAVTLNAGPPRIRSLELRDDSRLSREKLATLLTLQEGEVFDPQELERDIARLYGLNIFESVDYSVSGEDEVDVVIRTRQKSWGPNFLNFGLSLSDDFERSSPYSLGVRYTRTQVNPLGGEWRFDLQVGNNPLLRTEFYQPISYTSRFFIAPRVEASEFEGELFNDLGDRLAEYRVGVQEYGIDGGIALGIRSELRLGLSYINGRASLVVGDPSNEPIDLDNGRMRLLYRYDSIDNTAFPTAGQRIDATVQGIRRGLGADNNRNRAALQWLAVKTFGNTHVVAGANLGSNFGGDGGVDDQFELGGFFNLSGFRTGELRGQHAASLTLSAYRQIRFGDRVPLPLYAGMSVETGNVWNDSDDISADSLRFAGSLFVGAATPIGPAYLAYGLAENGKTAAYFFLGQPFGSSVR